MIKLANKTLNPDEKRASVDAMHSQEWEENYHTHTRTYIRERRKKTEGVHLTSANEMKRVT